MTCEILKYFEFRQGKILSGMSVISSLLEYCRMTTQNLMEKMKHSRGNILQRSINLKEWEFKAKVGFILVLSLLLIIIAINAKANDREKEIKQFIESELKYYPEARLVDLYKNYFQDAYGPGHIIPDTTQAGKYLDWELKQSYWTDTVPYQALGINHDYYRINLEFVKDGIIPRDTMLFALLESAPLARNPEIEDWQKEWQKVLLIIKETLPNIPNFEQDKQRIKENLSKGNVVMHHSKHYVKTYNPHYRIVHRSVFERWKEKYL